jgi:hypothetical protein
VLQLARVCCLLYLEQGVLRRKQTAELLNPLLFVIIAYWLRTGWRLEA